MSSMYAAGLQALSSQLTDISNLAAGDGKRLVHEGTSIVQRMTAADKVVYGMGFDGALAFDGVSAVTVQGTSIAPVGGLYTLTRDVSATTATFTGSAVVRTASYLFRCHLLVGDVTHVIHDDGIAGTSGSAGGGGALGGGGTLQRVSGAGADGRGTTGVGAAGSNATNSRGGAGGAGGASGANAGGNGGTVTAPAGSAGRMDAGVGLLHGWLANGASGPGSLAVNGGAGGGSGASNGTGNSGAGGSGGGRCRVYAFVCDFAGTIRAAGGAGGAATGGGNNGGGGGGGGGEAEITTEYLKRTPTVSAAGGGGGAPTGTGTAGSAGSAGQTTIVYPT